MNTIIQKIYVNKIFYSQWQNKERKNADRAVLNSLNSLIDARSLLPDNYINIISGVPQAEKLSYRQILNYCIRYAKTGKHLKNSLSITNDKDLNI